MPQVAASVIRQEGITTAQKNSLTVPSGEFWKVYDKTLSRWDYWNGSAWVALDTSSSGDVIAGANLGDNLLIRGDGAGKGVQNSGISVDDSDNLSGIMNIVLSGTVDGIDINTDVTENKNRVLIIAFSDETTAVDAATDKVTFTMPNFATTLTGIAVSFVAAPTTSAITIDVNEGGTSVLSTKITVDIGEFTSEDAATPPVISDSALAANAIMSVDVDTADSGGTSAGGKLIIYFTKA